MIFALLINFADKKLTSEDYVTVYQMTISACSLWYDIGLKLNTPEAALEDIKISNRDRSELCLLSMIDYCIKSSNGGLTWRTLCDALKSSAVNRSQLAGEIEEWLAKDLQKKSRVIDFESKYICNWYFLLFRQ